MDSNREGPAGAGQTLQSAQPPDGGRVQRVAGF